LHAAGSLRTPSVSADGKQATGAKERFMPTLPFIRRPTGLHARPPDLSGDPQRLPIRILILEDVVSDAELAERELKRAGLVCDVRRVETESTFRRRLEDFHPAVILSDFAMPGFDGMQALSIARQFRPDVPFIFVSGVMGEEYAIRALKDGATDYVLKNNLMRLPAAVERAIREAAERSARQALEDQLRQSEKLHRDLFHSNPHPMWIYDRESLRFLEVNDAAMTRYGYDRDEFLAMTIKDIRPEKDLAPPLDRIGTLRRGFNAPEVWRHLTKSGEVLHVEVSSHDIDMHSRPARIVVAYDVTERRKAELRLSESEARFRGLIEQAVDGIFIIDPEGNFLTVNTRGTEMLGYAPGELVGLNGRLTYVDGEQELHAQRLKEVGAGKTLQFERLVRRKDGSVFPADVSVKSLGNGMMQVFFHDISERVQQRERILRLQRIHAVLSSINSAIVRVQTRDELFEEACRIASQHAAFHIAWIGLVEQNTLKPLAWAGAGSEFFAHIVEAGSEIRLSPGGLANRALQGRHSVFSNDITDDPNLDFVRRAAVDRGCRSAIALPLTAAGEAVGIFMLYCDQADFFDDEEVKLLEELAADVSFALNVIAQREKADFLAYHDPMTGLPNRTLFFDRLTQHLNGSLRDQSNVVLIVIDLDRFRMVNDTLGRQGGDELLRMLTGRLRDIVRDQDTVARVGADSFALAFPGIWRTEEVAYAVELRSRKLFGEPFHVDGEELRISASGGIAIAPGDGTTPEALFANAEAALRNAKARNERFLFYQPDMNVRVAETLRLESRLRQAIEKEELILWYQPKIHLESGRITGFEALMRWQHPESGLIPPAQFIPLLEQTGLILEAGNLAMARVAADCEAWKAEGIAIPRIAVNVSPLQLRQKNFVAIVVEAAARTEEAGAALDLEITESVIMDNVEAIIPLLQTIRGLGVEIYVDDFGTGYSSLAYIARLPIHSLKIDRSFVVGMTQSQDSLAIVKSVISLAHTLRLSVVAEGMETSEQAALLRELKCDQAQGYLVSAPVPPEDVPDLLRKAGPGNRRP
jgi:diguanylate cyclase (GGDEF)-like protein/PAS domain S-box-containing protein